MAQQNKYITTLTTARDLLLAERRTHAEALASGSMKGHTTEERGELFIKAQSTIEAIDRAIGDEVKMEGSGGEHGANENRK